jgi:hypothetical protein
LFVVVFLVLLLLSLKVRSVPFLIGGVVVVLVLVVAVAVVLLLENVHANNNGVSVDAADTAVFHQTVSDLSFTTSSDLDAPLHSADPDTDTNPDNNNDDDEAASCCVDRVSFLWFASEEDIIGDGNGASRKISCCDGSVLWEAPISPVQDDD